MIHLYHEVPKNLKGNVLYPLNKLKNIYPESYDEEIGKYAGREFNLSKRIPILDCLWNDVLHFTAVNPADIKWALGKYAEGKVFRYFQFDPHKFEANNTIVYLFNIDDPTLKLTAKNFAAYDPDNLEKYAVLPKETKEYYNQQITTSGQLLLFRKIPHILYKGIADISSAKIVEF